MRSKFISAVLLLFILGAVGMLVYSVGWPVNKEKFTEFYILGFTGKADVYPEVFTLENDRVIKIQYGDVSVLQKDCLGKVTLGIVNREQRKVSYSVIVKIAGQPVSVSSNRNIVSEIGPIELQNEEKWEQEIGFTPQHIGDNQKVEFLLFKDSSADPYIYLHLWIDVKSVE